MALAALGAGGCRWLASYGSAASDAAVADAFGDHDGGGGEGQGFDGRADRDGGADAAGDGASPDGSSVDAGPPSPLCYQGWCWVGQPTNQFEAVWALDTGGIMGLEVVAVGRVGTVFGFANGKFNTQRVGGDVDYSDIWGDGAGNSWIVGSSGSVLHRPAQGGSWQVEALPPAVAGRRIHGVWGEGTSNGSVWAVTDEQILRRDHGTAQWTIHEERAGAKLRDVWGTGPLKVLVFDQSGEILEGTDSGTAFSPIDQIAVSPVEAGFAIGSDYYLAAGSAGLGWGPTGAIIKVGGFLPRALHGAVAESIWAVGDQGQLLRGQKGSWAQDAAAAQPLRGVWALGADDVVLCGEAGYLAYRSKTKQAWVQNSVMQLFIDVHVAPSGDAFVLAASNTVRHIEPSGVDSASSPFGAPPNAGTPKAIWASSATDVWVATSKGLYQRDGSGGWPQRLAGAVEAIWGDGVDNLWATAGQVIMRSRPAEPLANASAPSTFGQYTAISGRGQRVVAGTNLGQVVLLQSNSWTQLATLAAPGEVLALAIADTATIYAVVKGLVSNTLQRWTGPSPGQWQLLSTAAFSQDIWTSAAGELWLATKQGQVRRFDGSNWFDEPRLTHHSLQALHGSVNGSRLFAVGQHSTLLWRK